MTTSKLFIHTRPLQTCVVSCSLIPPCVCPIEISNLKFQIQTPDIPPKPASPSVFHFSVMAFFHVLNLKAAELPLTLPCATPTFNAIRKSPQPAFKTYPETSEFSPSPLLTPWSTPHQVWPQLLAFNSMLLNCHCCPLSLAAPNKLQLLYS